MTYLDGPHHRNGDTLFNMNDVSESQLKMPPLSPANNKNFLSRSPLSPGHPSLMKSITAPVLSSAKTYEQRFLKPDGVHIISPLELGKLITTQEQSSLLILDLRSFTDYSKSFIKHSLHISLPSTLLKRKNFTFEKLLQNLTPSEQQLLNTKFDHLNGLKIIVYDNSTIQDDNSISLACFGITSKILNYPLYKKDKNSVSVLSSGFFQFEILFPELVSDIILPDSSIDTANSIEDISMSETNLSIRLSSMNISTSPSSLATPQKNFANDSPISASSPISALFKFQLPFTKTNASPFKIPQNEESMNLESYLNAVNIKEEYSRWQHRKENQGGNSLHTFQFPKRTETDQTGSNNKIDEFKDKLSVQIKYSNLVSKYSQEEIDSNIPKWFQELMSRTKVQFASQFQKLDILEKKRLNSSLSMKSSTRSSRDSKGSIFAMDFKYPGHLQTSSDVTMSSNNSISIQSISPTPNPSLSNNKYGHQKRSHSQPFLLSSMKKKWLHDINNSDEDDEEDNIVISSGVELGSKNRYKDIFPYEHTRVKLRKRSRNEFSSISSILSNELKENIEENEELDEVRDNLDIWDNYINANYLKLPELTLENELRENLEFSPLPPVSEKVRYIATQAPLLSTVHDFYTCILNDRVPLVIALTNEVENGLEKCFKYWEERDYNGIKIELSEELQLIESNDNVILRKIKLLYDNNTKTYELLQLQIKNWPDLGTLNDPLEIIQAVVFKNILIKTLFDKNVFQKDFLPTVLVHCSAGCGRTGTWCTIDSILSNLDNFDILRNEFRKGSSENKLYDPVAWTINVFRKQRISMVQNINQFLFIYDSLLHFFTLKINDDVYQKTQDKQDAENSMMLLLEKFKDLNIIERFVESKITEPLPIFV
ncbi:hypothetical protein KAFR_0L01070 [Kazachstania africana CBS 2517]|uniref:protein-tyrosine-phosphatase n=1 Tax=Kazachstania africana (strain ATCC 22294 / BCRC 22015 / CBS 2517 / CECT 1963 / NBRC 1671 / NRRL Y-8276) TaxID=1071382 RepID=H2B265_KAZAF|nr:hypothetical protein KAFR_0L01070 [Kazachstania africana CBS 2517]CCF60715.1 hypothetical protein KAFR_0L01070 [Kazachstania africana CBS 2517]